VDNNNLYLEGLNYVFRDSNSRTVKHNTYMYILHVRFIYVNRTIITNLSEQRKSDKFRHLFAD